MSSMLLHMALGAVMATAAPDAPRVPSVPRVSADSVQQAQARTLVEVDNRNFNDATVYAIQGVRRVRLGWVNGLSTQKLVIPDDMVRSAMPIRFAIRPLAGRTRVSEQLSVSRGDLIGLFVSPF